MGSERWTGTHVFTTYERPLFRDATSTPVTRSRLELDRKPERTAAYHEPPRVFAEGSSTGCSNESNEFRL